MTVRELEQIVLGYAPLEGAVKGDVNGLLYGDPEAEVAGIAVTWSPTVRVLQEAAADGLNFVLTHELLWFPAMPTAWYTTLPEAERPHNQARKRILDRFAMAVCRCHSNWDPVEEHGIADACARALGFGAPVHRSQYLRMYHIAPRTLAQLAQDAKIHLGAPGVRVVGDLARPVERVGIAYGGFIVGRAIWKDAIPVYATEGARGLGRWARSVGRDRFLSLVAAARGYARL